MRVQFDDFANAALTQTPQELAEAVRRATIETIDQPSARLSFLKVAQVTARFLHTKYHEDLERAEIPGSTLDPMNVTGLIYKAGYLYETIFTLSNDVAAREKARTSAQTAYTAVQRLEDERPNWRHNFPLSAKIAGCDPLKPVETSASALTLS